MPIRKDLRHFYRTPEFKAARKRAVKRSGNKCEECGKPNGERVETHTGRAIGILGHRGLPVMFWRLPGGGWRDQWNVAVLPIRMFALPKRVIRVVCTLAHLDHNPANNSEENTKFLCQWCHLNYDKLHHKETRSTRKDAARPLLKETA